MLTVYSYREAVFHAAQQPSPATVATIVPGMSTIRLASDHASMALALGLSANFLCLDDLESLCLTSR